MKKMVYSNERGFYESVYRGKNGFMQTCSISNFLFQEKDKAVVMQYTGLKDCEGNEIYEGDILEFNDNMGIRSGGYKSDSIVKGYVLFDEGMYRLYDYENLYDLYEVLVNDEGAKLIGNIYESGE